VNQPATYSTPPEYCPPQEQGEPFPHDADYGDDIYPALLLAGAHAFTNNETTPGTNLLPSAGVKKTL
jgi:hypothetical protein